jgi:hypothetical protein
MAYFQNTFNKIEFPDGNLIEKPEAIPTIPAMLGFTKKKRITFFSLTPPSILH